MSVSQTLQGIRESKSWLLHEAAEGHGPGPEFRKPWHGDPRSWKCLHRPVGVMDINLPVQGTAWRAPQRGTRRGGHYRKNNNKTMTWFQETPNLVKRPCSQINIISMMAMTIFWLFFFLTQSTYPVPDTVLKRLYLDNLIYLHKTVYSRNHNFSYWGVWGVSSLSITLRVTEPESDRRWLWTQQSGSEAESRHKKTERSWERLLRAGTGVASSLSWEGRAGRRTTRSVWEFGWVRNLEGLGWQMGVGAWKMRAQRKRGKSGPDAETPGEPGTGTWGTKAEWEREGHGMELTFMPMFKEELTLGGMTE